MGLFGIGKPPAKKRTRGPAKSGMEKLNAQKAKSEEFYNKWLKRLEEHGDPRFDEMMLQRHGMAPDTRDPVQYMVKTKKALAEAGMIKEDSGGVADMVRQFAPLVQGLMPGGGQSGQAVQSGLPPAPPGYAWALVPIGGAGQPAQQPQPRPEPPQSATTAIATTEPPPGDVSPLSRTLIERFRNAAPEDAATALLGSPAPMVDQLAQLICQTPDDDLDTLLGHLAVDNPNFAGVFAWMRARPDWLRGFVVAIRKAKGAPAVVESPATAA